MKRAEARRTEADQTKAHTLYEMDYLLLVNDETRQGALRFANAPGASFLAHDGALVPPLINLPKLLLPPTPRWRMRRPQPSLN